MKKRIFTLLLAALILSSTLAACNNDQTESEPASENISSVESQNSSDDDSKEESKDHSKEESSEPDAINPEFKTVISTGCSYTNTEEAGAAYEDSYKAELTDGNFAPQTDVSYGDTKLSGYAPASGKFDVVIDLGREYDNIDGFAGSFLLTKAAGIAPPSSVSINVSVDGKSWTRAGSLRACEYVADTMGIYNLDCKQYMTARYVKFTITKGSAWVFLDELMVYADVPAEENIIDIEDGVKKLYAAENTNYGQLLDSVLKGAPDYSLRKTLISSKRTYTLKGDVVDKYADSSKLTDGSIGNYYESGTWVGFDGASDVEIVITTGSNAKDISSLELSTFAAHSSKIYLPLSVTFSVSDDNKTFIEIGRVYSPLKFSDGCYKYVLENGKTFSAKYVKFTVKGSGEGTMMFIDEAAVYAYRNTANQDDPYYSDPVYPDNGKITYFPSTESDYNTEQNLILGKGQYVVPGTIITKAESDTNTPEDTKWLTDGKIPASMGIHDGGYFKSNNGVKRTIVYDLGASCSVDRFGAAFLDRQEWAVYAPGKVGVEVSQDAENWYIAGYIICESTPTTAVIESELVLDAPVQARYVRFVYGVYTWAGCAELTVYGKKNASGATALANANLEKVRMALDVGYQAPTKSILKGASDICLMYHSLDYDYTEKDLMPYLAYLDTNGNIKDTMFDGFLFLLSGKFPSGVAQHMNSVKTDWEWELKQVFANGKNAMALETAAAKVKKELGLADDYKFKYYLSVYYPRPDTTNFGDVDGDGVSEDCSKFEDCQKIIKWYLDLALEYNKNAAFKNIELAGFYWFNEAIDSSENSYKLINNIADQTKERGYDLFWIPYYCASGVSEWAEYGFATACMQPNYVFNLTTPLSNIKNAADIIKRLGMCIEIEISGDALSKDAYYRRYLEYLKGGIYYGYMKDCIHMYYQDTLAYNKAAYSSNAMARSTYDYTYQFIKGTLDIYPDKQDDISVEVTKNEVYNYTFEKKGEYIITRSPAHGTVTIEPNGGFTYYPDKDYTGEDSFEYKYSEGIDYSVPCKINVNVK